MSTQVRGGLPVYIGRVPLLYAVGAGGLKTLTNEYSMQFDGVDDYIQAEIPVDGYNDATLRTFSFWVKIDTLAVSYTPFFCGYGVVNVFRYSNSCGIKTHLGVSKLRWSLEVFATTAGCYYETEAIDGSGAAPDLTDGNWHHIVIYNPVDSTANNGDIVNCKIWLDGSLLTGTGYPGTAAVRGFSSGGLCLGAGNSGGSSAQIYLNGNIDEFAYWDNLELTDDQVLDIYDATSAGEVADLNSLDTGPTRWYRTGDLANYQPPQWLLPEVTNGDKVGNYSFDFDGASRVYRFRR